MRLGLDSFSFHITHAAGRYDLFRTLDWMEAQGLAGLQININGPKGRFLGGEPGDTAHIRRVRQALAQKGFFSEIGGRDTSPDMLAWQLRLCAEVGADVLRTLLVYQGTLEKTFDQTRRDLEASLPLARSLGVRIALENHEDVTAAELRQFLDLIDDPYLGACLDTGNDLVVYGDPLEAARQLAPRALSTHLKDHRLVRVGGVVQSVGVPLGTGDIDLPAILGVIRRDSRIDRLLIQNTTGYASVLNPFKRADLHPPHDFPGLMSYATTDELQAAGLVLNLNNLSPVELTALALQQERVLVQDIAYLHKLIR